MCWPLHMNVQTECKWEGEVVGASLEFGQCIMVSIALVSVITI